MKKLIAVIGIFSLGVALGRMFDAQQRAEAGGNSLPPCQDINGDSQSDITDAIFFLQWRFLGGPEPACPPSNVQPGGLPDTGQTKCYDQAGAGIPCDSTTCSGQDGRYATGCPSEGRFVDNGDGTVTYTCTGLMWEKETADVNVDGQSTDQDYLRWCDALAYCENMSFAGHDDWRLPNVRELQSIVDYGRFNPSIDPVFGAFSAAYWSSTSAASDPAGAWGIYFDGGVVDNSLGKDSSYYVRAVRGGE